jgi:hypothetical protein
MRVMDDFIKLPKSGFGQSSGARTLFASKQQEQTDGSTCLVKDWGDSTTLPRNSPRLPPSAHFMIE